MPTHDDLGCRMKEFYEAVPKIKLMRRTPVAIRIDGKAFHTFTKGFAKPFDNILIKSMQETMQYMCEHIQGCVLGYTQSDEITLILVDYKKLTTNAWFDYEVQKMCSISASMATMAFNRFFADNVRDYDLRWKNGLIPQSVEIIQQHNDYMSVLQGAILKGAMFDARCFNIPKEEVTNLIYWRQLDASRNSIQMLGQAYFSHNELHNKTCSNIQDMLMEQKGINWNDLPIQRKRGSCCIRKSEINDAGENNERAHWVIDNEIPLFKGDERGYIETLINFE